MEATQVKPQANGVFKIAVKGKLKCQIGDDNPVFEVEVLTVYNEYCDVRRAFEDKDGSLVQDQISACNAAVAEYVSGLAGHPVGRSEAVEFIAGISARVADLRPFWQGRRGGTASSPSSTEASSSDSES